MPSTYTLNNGIELIATGEQSGTWGDTTNTNMSLLDTALDGQVTVTLASAGTSGSPNTLPISDGAVSDGRNRMVFFNDGADLGATAYVQLTPNDAEKIVYIRNALSGSRSIIVFQGTYNASNDYEIPAGTTAVVYFNGGGTGAVAANVFNNAHFDALNIVGAAAVGTTLTVGTSLNIASSTTVDGVLDEDDMSSDSATKLATQQSIKAYVDSQVGTVDTWAEVLANGNTTGATDAVVTAGQKLTTNTIDETTAASGVTIDSVLLKDGGATLTDDLVVNTDNLFVDTSASKTMFGTTYNADSGNVTIRGTYGANNASDYRGNNALALTGADPGTTAAGSGINLAFVPVTNRGATAIISGENTGTNKEGGAQLRFSVGGSSFPTTQKDMLMLNYDNGAIFNEGSADLDFRVESDSNTHALFVEAASSYVGINNSAPDRPVHLKSAGNRNYIKAETTGTTDSEEAGFDVKAGSNNYLVGALGGTDNRFFIYDLANALDKFTIKQGDIIINDSGVDGDFRVESDSNTHALFVDAGNSRVGINVSAPSAPLHVDVSGTADALILTRDTGTNGQLQIDFTTAFTNFNSVNGGYVFSITGTEIASFESTGTFTTQRDSVFNEGGGDYDFRVESDGASHMLFVDAGNNRVGIGQASPSTTLDIASSGETGLRLLNTLSTISGGTALSQIVFENSDDSGGIQGNYYIKNVAADGFAATNLDIQYNRNGGATSRLKFVDATGNQSVVFNDDSGNIDFRVESDSNTHMLFVDAGNNRIGVGNSAPKGSVHLKDITDFNGSDVYYVAQNTTSNRNAGFKVMDESDNYTSSLTYDNGSNAGVLTLLVPSNGSGQVTYSATEMVVVSNNSSIPMKLSTNSTERLRLNAGSDGAVFNELSNNYDFRVESDSNTHMFFLDASANRISIGTSSTGDAQLTVQNENNAYNTQKRSATTISGAGTRAAMLEGVYCFNTTSSGNQLSIPVFSQSSNWKPYYVELIFQTGEYNAPQGPIGGRVIFEFRSLTSLSGLNVLLTEGNVSGMAVSGMNLLVNFTTAYNSGLADYEGVMCHARVFGSAPQYIELDTATLN